MIVLPSSVAGQALLRSHVAVRQVFAFDAAGSPLYGGLPLPVVGGSISWTWTDAVRCTATLTLPATDQLVPQHPGDMLGIGLARLDVYMGTPGQLARVAQLYVNRVTRRRPEGTLTLDCGDASSRVATAISDAGSYTVPYTSAAPFYWNDVDDMIVGLLRHALNDATLTLSDPGNIGTPHLYPFGGPGNTYPNTTWTVPLGLNYLDTLTSWADYAGGYLYPDQDGQWTLAADPQGPGMSVLTLTTGDGGTVARVEDGYDRAGVVANHYIIKALGNSTIGTSDEYATADIAGDYAAANIGRIDRYVEVTNWGAGWALIRADELIARVAPALRRWTIDAIPYPGLEPGDTITLDETATGGGTTDLMVDTITIPFDLERTMTLDCRNAPIT